MRAAACVMAGGRSRRMGGLEKALAPLKGRPLIDHLIERLKPQVEYLVINANGPAEFFAQWHLPVIADVIPGWRGPLVGLLSAMEWAAEHLPDVTDILSVPADTPFIPRDLLATLMAAREAAGAAVAMSGGRLHPLVGVWPVGDAAVLRRAIVDEGLAKAESWVSACHATIVTFPDDGGDPFFNINTQADLLRAERVATD